MDWSDFLASAAILGTALVAFLNFTKDKKKVDVDADTTKAATEIAIDESSVKQALQLRNEALEERRQAKIDAQEEVEKARREADRRIELAKRDLNSRIDRVLARVETVEEQLSRTRNVWRSWAEDLHDRWETHRQNSFPPALPSDD